MTRTGARTVTALAALGIVIVAACGSAVSTSSPAVPDGSASSIPAPTASADEATDLGSLAADGRLDSAPVAIDGSGRQLYAFDVDADGGRLRATLDLSNRDDCVAMTLVDPTGGVARPVSPDLPRVCPHGADGTGQVFDISATADATPGKWLATIDVTDARDLAFRLRVVHEAAAGGQPEMLTPDLVPWLPWEFGFAAPASENPGTAHDRDNQPGDPAVSCHPEEEPGATRCLRFSAGVYNVGDGPMFVTFRDEAAYQHVYRADGTPLDNSDNESAGQFEETVAGSGEWHDFHQHRHLGDLVLYELFEVTSPTGGLRAVDSVGRKHGYCTFSQQIADWTSIAQDPQYASFPQGGAFCDAAMTLERGWGDIYRWQRPGQYVSYADVAEADGSMRAGRYVVRFTVDPLDTIVETDETNNVGYASIDVVDGGSPGQDSVVVCEQGLGTDPWDPAKTVVPDRFAWAKATLDPGYVAPACT